MSRDLTAALLVGSAAAALTALLVWRFADRRLRTELTSGGTELTRQLASGSTQISTEALAARDRVLRQLDAAIGTQILPQVTRQVQQQLTANGITKDRVDRLSRALELAERAGVI